MIYQLNCRGGLLCRALIWIVILYQLDLCPCIGTKVNCHFSSFAGRTKEDVMSIKKLINLNTYFNAARKTFGKN